MKYLIWLVLVVAGIWWIRQQRKTPANTQKKTDSAKPSPDSGPQVMTPCAHCGVHLPESDAIQGAQGVYCSEAHRLRQEG
jgi:uncharacterized protein